MQDDERARLGKHLSQYGSSDFVGMLSLCGQTSQRTDAGSTFCRRERECRNVGSLQ